MFFFYDEKFLVPRPAPKLGDHTLSAVCDCFIFDVTLYLWKQSLPLEILGRATPWWLGPA